MWSTSFYSEEPRKTAGLLTTRPTLLIFLWFVFGRKSYPKIRTLNIATQSRGRARNGCKILSIVGCYDDRAIDVRRE